MPIRCHPEIHSLNLFIVIDEKSFWGYNDIMFVFGKSARPACGASFTMYSLKEPAKYYS